MKDYNHDHFDNNILIDIKKFLVKLMQRQSGNFNAW
jgi:hypothetical protein